MTKLSYVTVTGTTGELGSQTLVGLVESSRTLQVQVDTRCVCGSEYYKTGALQQWALVQHWFFKVQLDSVYS
jgi:hypothetical protein